MICRNVADVEQVTIETRQHVTDNFPCDKCGAPAGQPCVKTTTGQPYGRNNRYHVSRGYAFMAHLRTLPEAEADRLKAEYSIDYVDEHDNPIFGFLAVEI